VAKSILGSAFPIRFLWSRRRFCSHWPSKRSNRLEGRKQRVRVPISIFGFFCLFLWKKFTSVLFAEMRHLLQLVLNELTLKTISQQHNTILQIFLFVCTLLFILIAFFLHFSFPFSIFSFLCYFLLRLSFSFCLFFIYCHFYTLPFRILFLCCSVL
jgi:hypothetical protein